MSGKTEDDGTGSSLLTEQESDESESEEQKEHVDYQLTMSSDGEVWNITVHNETEFSKADLCVMERKDGEDNVVYSTGDANGKVIIETEKDRLYTLQLTGESVEDPLLYYNLDLSETEELWLEQKDGYAYISYRKKDSEEKITEDQYRYMTYESARVRYILIDGLAIRQKPDKQEGQLVRTCFLGKKVEVFGQAKGLMDGVEGDWYILKLDSGYDFISAKEIYSTDNKAKAESEIRKMEQKDEWVELISPDQIPDKLTDDEDAGKDQKKQMKIINIQNF